MLLFQLFDPTVKKKKKKKKAPFDLDAAMTGESTTEPAENGTEEKPETVTAEEEVEDKKDDDGMLFHNVIKITNFFLASLSVRKNVLLLQWWFIV